MINRDIKKLILDIIDCINSIDDHLEKRRVLAEYLGNKTKRRAVEREIEIIGEVMSKILKLNSTIEISHARTIVDLRNRVIHAYDSVDDILIWKIVMKDLPILLEDAKQLLNEN